MTDHILSKKDVQELNDQTVSLQIYSTIRKSVGKLNQKSNIDELQQNIISTRHQTKKTKIIKYQSLIVGKKNVQSIMQSKMISNPSQLDQNPIVRSSMKKSSLIDRNLRKKKSYSNQNQSLNEIQNQPQKKVRIKSQKTINYCQQFDAIQQQTNPQTNIYIELAQQFQYVSEFSIIKKTVTQIALKNHFNIVQNTNQLLTIKYSKFAGCKCVIQSCFNTNQSNVYQLKNSLYKKNKAKFILISGSQIQFQQFFKTIMIQLWLKKQLKLKQISLVTLFFDIEKTTLSSEKKQFTRLYNQYSFDIQSKKPFSYKDILNTIHKRISQRKLSQNKQQTLQNYNKKIQNQLQTLKNKLFFSQNDQIINLDDVLMTKTLQQMFYQYLPVNKLFTMHYSQDFKTYQHKKHHILKNYSLKDIFKYLQIQQAYELFLINKSQNSQKTKKGQSPSNKVIQDTQAYLRPQNCQKSINHPYNQCIRIIQQSNKMHPLQILNSLQSFYIALKQTYNKSYVSYLKYSTMDDQLPLTIYCLLMVQVDQTFYGRLKWVKSYLDHVDEYQMPRKVVVMIDAAFDFINKQWRLQLNSNHQGTSISTYINANTNININTSTNMNANINTNKNINTNTDSNTPVKSEKSTQ